MRKFITLLPLAVLCCFVSWAQQFQFVPDRYSKILTSNAIRTSLLFPSGSSTYGDPVPRAEHDRWTEMVGHASAGTTPPYSFKSKQNLVRVAIDPADNTVASDYRYAITLEVKGYNNPATPATATTTTVVLELSYDKDSLQPYNDHSVYKCSGFDALEVKVTGVQQYNGSTWNPVVRSTLAPNFYIETELLIQRFDNAAFSLFPGSSSDGKNLNVSWSTIRSVSFSCSGSPGPSDFRDVKPIEYELEWTYIDDYKYDISALTPGYKLSADPSFQYNFRNNSTRVRVPAGNRGGSYSIPLIYEHGAIAFRVRAIRPAENDFRKVVYSEWTLPVAGTLNSSESCFSRYGYVIQAPHTNDSLNWQYTVSFAEEGKYKHVINYFDGSLKDRQTQTKINSDSGYVIAVEKAYDHEGRPALQTLPVPVQQSHLLYRNDILTNAATGKAYTPADIDPIRCSQPDSIPKLHTNARANIYYSPLNPDKNGMQKFVPDAEGFPIVQTIFSPDNTNKVMWQGGAGLEHQLWRGHGTSYDYVRASQRELNQLLGTEAGNYQFYPKQVVTDPNGQTSYSIMNPAGQVVATGMAGIPDTVNAPIDTIPNYNRGTVSTSNLLANLQQDTLRNRRIAENTFYADATNTHKFQYSASVPPFAAPGCVGNYLAARVKYKMTVSNDCGVPLIADSAELGSHQTLTSATPVSHTSALLTASLDKGKYIVSKELSFSEHAIDSQVRAFVKSKQPACYYDEHFFVKNAVESTAFPCIDSGTTNECDERKKQMMKELWPGAKYGQYKKDQNGKFNGGDINSIFTIKSSGANSPSAIGIGVTAYATGTDNNGNYRVTPLPGQNPGLCDHYPLGYADIHYEHSSDGYNWVQASIYNHVYQAYNNSVSGLAAYYQTPTYLVPIPRTADTALCQHPCSYYSSPFHYYRTSVNVDSNMLDKLYVSYYEVRSTVDTVFVNGIASSWVIPGNKWSNQTDSVHRDMIHASGPSLNTQTGDPYPGPYVMTNPVIRKIAYYKLQHLQPGSNTIVYKMSQGAAAIYENLFSFYSPYGFKFRYQDSCLVPLSHPVTIKGVQYTSLASIDPQTLIDNFSDELAEALLPLHPEYCKLAFCKDGGFTEELENIQTWQDAQAKSRFTLNNLITNDPVYTDAPSQATYDKLAYFKGTQTSLGKTIERLALENAYCAAGNFEEQLHCASNLYNTQIAAGTFIDDATKQRYFEQLKAMYLANRSYLKQLAFDGAGNSCGPCDTNRMTLSGNPVFPSVFDATGTADTDDLPQWMKDMFTAANNGAAITQPSNIADSVNALNDTLDAGRINAIMKALANCSLTPSTMTTLRNNLIAAATNATITPTLIKDVIANTPGIDQNDLCHPFLVQYGLYDPSDDDLGSFACKPDVYYTDMPAFFNRSQVQNVLTTPATVSFALNTANSFEKSIADYLGQTNIQVQSSDINVPVTVSGTTTNIQYRMFSITPVGGSSTGNTLLQFFFRPKDKNSNPLVSASSVSTNAALCLNSDIQAGKQGAIAQKTAILDFQFNGSSTVSRYFLWTDKLNLMGGASTSQALTPAITCKDLSNTIASFFSDQATYEYDTYTNHPLFERTLTNYLNYKLQKKHVYADYAALMDGCAISDKHKFNSYLASYFIHFSSEAYANAFVQQLNTFNTDQNAHAVIILNYRYSGTAFVWIDLNNIPAEKLLAYKHFLDGNNGQYVYLGSTARMYRYSYPWDIILIRNADCAPLNFGTNGAQSPSQIIEMKDVDGNYIPYQINYYTPNSSGPKANADALDNSRSLLSSQCPIAVWYSNHHLWRSSDYNNPAKQQYLNYVYGLTTSNHNQIIDSVSPGYLATRLSSFNGKTLTYDDPWCRGTKTDLYAYTQPSPSDPGYARLSGIIGNIASSFTNKLFPAGSVNTASAVSNGRLKAYAKANGVYWYRFFDTDNRLYNVYLLPPQGTGINLQSFTYTAGSLRALQGDGEMRSFKVTVGNGSSSFDCVGYTDFAIGTTSQKLANVILMTPGDGDFCTDTSDCEKQQLAWAVTNGKMRHQQYFDSLTSDISRRMLAHLVKQTTETLNHTTFEQKYHHTLYYYDRAGNLVKTVPPAGVIPITSDVTLATVDNYRTTRNLASGGLPTHKKASVYQYNSLNQLVYQQTPDGGVTHFFYDPSGRPVFSQNSKQRLAGRYSYTQYDKQGRVVETGEVKLGCVLTNVNNQLFDSTSCSFGGGVGIPASSGLHPDFVANAYNELSYPPDVLSTFIGGQTKYDVVLTVYDTLKENLDAVAGEMLSAQENLRKRVSAILYFPVLANNFGSFKGTTEKNYQFGAFYSYDLNGNVKTVTYDYKPFTNVGQRYKRVDYDYDLLSGKVNLVSYNRGHPDQFYHRYEYDGDNRITRAYTSNDGAIWNTDARYTYYKHGPLADVKIGNNLLQSLEYAYTIQGWLKAINGEVLRPDKDMGNNGGPADATYARDVVAHALDYFRNDYKSIDPAAMPTANFAAPAKSLYNGNIVRQTTSIAALGNLQRSYRYDQLQRLKLAANATVNESTLAVMPSDIFKSSYAYDPDGNIQNLKRWDGAATPPAMIDNFTYNYTAGNTNNKLLNVQDAGTNNPAYQDLKGGQPAGNYAYDAIGNLVKDRQEGLQNIDWNAYGKVKLIKDSVTGDAITFHYDGGGNRIWKEVAKKIPNSQDEDHRGEYYVRDAQGNILAVYGTHSRYATKYPIKAANDPILNNPGFKSMLGGFVREYGSFGSLFTDRMAQDRPVWLEGQVDAKSTGFYLERSEELMNRVIYSTPDYLNPVQARDIASPGSEVVYPSLLANNRNGGASWYAEILGYSTEGKKLLEQYGKKMATSLSNQLWADYSLTFLPSNPVASAQMLYDHAVSHDALGLLAGSLQDYVDLSMSTTPATGGDQFLKAVVAEDVIWESTNLRGRTAFTSYIQQSLDRYGARPLLVSFFDSWSSGRYWLEQNSSSDQLFGVVLNDDPEMVIGSHLGGESDAELISTVIADMPELTVGEYLNRLSGRGLLDPGGSLPLYDFGLVTDTVRLAEHHIYGSSRLGVQRYAAQTPVMNTYQYGNPSAQIRTLSGLRPWWSGELGDWIDSTKKDVWTGALAGNKDVRSWKASRILGYRNYELTDHLGNVLATVLDRKTGKDPVTIGSLQKYTHWHADLAGVQDYYPFGMLMPGRYKFAGDSSEYRFGFNGQQRTDEIAGKGNHNTALFWEYDTRLGRRWNVDPVDQISISNYAVLALNPISHVDPLGNTEDHIEVDDKEKTYRVTKTDDPYDIVFERKYDQNGNSIPIVKSNDGKTPNHYQKGAWQNYLKNKGYEEKKPLRGAQSEEFAVEMAALDGAGKLLGKGLKWAWGRTFGGAAAKTGTEAVVAQGGKNYAKLLAPTNEYDVVKTLYRGTTGSEAGSTVLFLTDDAAVAATYVKNGGQVMQYPVTQFGLKSLEQAGELTMKTGTHGATGAVSTEYMFQGKDLVQTLNSLAKPLQ